jgi:hypothetical protein
LVLITVIMKDISLLACDAMWNATNVMSFRRNPSKERCKQRTVNDAVCLSVCSACSSILKMEAVRSSEWLVNSYHTTRCHVQISSISELSQNLYLIYCRPKFKLESGEINKDGKWNPGWAQFLVNAEVAYKVPTSNSNTRSSLKGTKLQIQFNVCCIRII